MQPGGKLDTILGPLMTTLDDDDGDGQAMRYMRYDLFTTDSESAAATR